ncbi:MAG: 4Fe-4S dicluster domain-containing protein [Bryobacteraceae bacterium]
MSTAISVAALGELIAGWIGQGKLVAAPVQVGDRLLYQALSSAAAAVFDARRRPANSIKEFLFPRHEQIFRYRLEGKEIALSDVVPEEREQIVIAAKPCDAAALPILDRVFNWDCEDSFYTARRARTTVVTLACAAHDDACFCTSVGSGPADESGSDAMLFDRGDGQFEVKAITEKGRALFGVSSAEADDGTLKRAPQTKFDPARVARYLEANFESPLWKDLTLACLGCGACAYTCPTCHCFDIVDEGNAAGGARVKNWDSCQFPFFTLHASGHNPRSAQPQRQRQRLFHKFSIYPAKFGSTLCTGCGNCERNCPVGLGVLKVLQAIDGEARRLDEKEPVQA